MTIESDPAKGLNAAVADTLNGERVASGLTFDALARATDISKRQLIRLLSTKDRHLDVAVISAIAAEFNLTSVEVFEMAERRMAREERSERRTGA